MDLQVILFRKLETVLNISKFTAFQVVSTFNDLVILLLLCVLLESFEDSPNNDCHFRKKKRKNKKLLTKKCIYSAIEF